MSTTHPHLNSDGPTATVLSTASIIAVGRYRLGEEIARGGMGAVFRVRDENLDRDLALKVMLADPSLEVAVAVRFVAEAKLTASLQHPGIVPVHEVGTLPDGRPFFTMKLVRGRTLAAILADRGRERLETIDAFERVCQAVGYAHSRGVIHRDIKPHNVMVGDFGEVQVMDWGLAKELAPRSLEQHVGSALETVGPCAADSEAADPDATTDHRTADTDGRTRPGATMGTPAYMPPEQARGDWDHVGVRADVFALGAVLCHVLTGKPPYTGGGSDAVLRRAAAADLAEAFGRLDGCGADSDLVALCKQCLAADPDARPADGGEVAGLVAAFRAGVEARLRAAETERAETAVRAVEERKRRRVRRALVAAVVLLVAGGLGTAWWDAEQASKRHQLEGERKSIEVREQVLREVQERQTRDGVAASLRLATGLRGVYKYTAAAETLDNAARLAAGGLTEDLIPMVEQARGELAFVRQLDDIRLTRAVSIKVVGSKLRTRASAVPPAYKAAFLARGFDLAAGDSVAVAVRIAGSPIRAELVAALDDWAVFEPDPALRDRLFAVSRFADRGPWSDLFRNPAVRANPLLLAWLARTADPRELSPNIVSSLGDVMALNGLNPRRVLLAAQSAHPDDFIIPLSLGIAFNTRKDHREAASHFRAALAVRPDNAFTHHALGKALDELDDSEGAIREYQAALRLNPNLAFTHTNLGSVYYHRREFEAAAVEHRAAIKIDPELAIPHLNLAKTIEHLGDLDGAVLEYRMVLEMNLKQARIHTAAALLLKKRGDEEEARKEAETARDLIDENAEIQNDLGLVLKKKGDADGAVKAFNAALSIAPKQGMTYFNLGNMKREKGDLDGAIRDYQTALKVDPAHAKSHASTHGNLGNVLGERGRIKEAVEAWQAAVDIDPKNANAHNHLGSYRLANRDTTGAIKHFRTALDADPDNVMAHNNLGNALVSQNDLDGAIAEYRTVVRLAPKLASAHRNLGLALVRKGELDGAIAEFRIAIDLDPKNVQVRSNLGTALIRKKDLDGAVRAFRAAVEIDPSYATGHYNLGLALYQKEDVDGAVRSFREATKLNPKYTDAHNNLGIALSDKGDLAGAIAAFREAVRLDTRHTSAYGNLALALFHSGDIDAAHATAQAAARIDPQGSDVKKSLAYFTKLKTERDERLAKLGLLPPKKE